MTGEQKVPEPTLFPLPEETQPAQGDVNNFAHSGQKSEGGCFDNKHNFDRTSANVVAKPDGTTAIIMKCLACNQYVEISSQLNINDLITETEAQRPPMAPQERPMQQPNHLPTDEDVMRKLFQNHG